MQYFVYFLFSCLMLVSCGANHPQVPSSYHNVAEAPHLMPDYSDVVVPFNIAPLNFTVDEEGIEKCVAKVTYPGGEMTFGQVKEILFNLDDWKSMLNAAKGDSLSVQLFAKREGEWICYPTFYISVSTDPIDPFVSYRLIPPSYTTYEQIYLCQRNLENFEEKLIYNNQMIDDVEGGHCVNCHAFQNYHTDRMQFHVRAEFASTVIYDNGKAKKVNLNRNGAISAGVYPAWHPTLNVLAYSMNMSYQNFHTSYHGKVEVQDSQAGLMFYDNEHDQVKVICNEPDQLSAFPSWSPDGEYLYYSTAHFAFMDSVAMEQASNINYAYQHELIDRYTEVEYDIVRRKFDAERLEFGPAEMVWEASASGLSATVPRISPDGRYLLVGLGDYGTFHIWHPEADLYVADLAAQSDTLSYYPLTEANSPCAESFHNWSSNGRWIVFESRRDDGNYTRLYFSYFDREGRAHKAFELPQSTSDYELMNLKSYNIPEFTTEPVKTTPQRLARVIQSHE